MYSDNPNRQVFRFGADEIVVTLEETSPGQSRIVHKLNGHEFSHTAHPFPVEIDDDMPASDKVVALSAWADRIRMDPFGDGGEGDQYSDENRKPTEEPG
jgi:hypothetical protein